MLIHFNESHLSIGLALLVIMLVVVWWRKRSLSYLFFFAIFGVYLLAVAKEIIFPFYVKVDGSGAVFGLNFNLIPFYFGNCLFFEICFRNIIDNIVMTIPFGFGICFLMQLKPKNAFWLALAVGLGFELCQLIISLIFQSSFRVIDINDVILNGTGVLLGYTLFRAFARLYLTMTEYFDIQHKWIFADIYMVTRQVTK